MSLVAKEMKRHYTDSVDILVLTPGAEVITHQPEMTLPYRNQTQAYLTLLQHSVNTFEGKRIHVGKGSRLDRNPISLGTELMEVLQVFRASGTDTPDYTVVEIDTTPFERGGILHIEIHVGENRLAGTFELFDVDTEISTKNDEDETLDGAWNVSSGGVGHIFHDFSRGRRFKLVATAVDKQKNVSNAFLARVSIVPPFEK